MDQREDVRTLVMSHLAKGVEAARERLDPATGRFLAENGGWAVTNQDVIYPLGQPLLDGDNEVPVEALDSHGDGNRVGRGG